MRQKLYQRLRNARISVLAAFISILPTLALAQDGQSPNPKTQGFIDSFIVKGDQIIAQGWVGAAKSNDRVASISIWLADTLVYDGDFKQVERPDVVNAMGRTDWLKSGWRIHTKLPGNLKRGEYTIKVLARLDNGQTDELNANSRLTWIHLEESHQHSRIQTLRIILTALLITLCIVRFRAVLFARRINRVVAYSSFASALFGIKLWLIGSYGNATPFWDQWGAEAASLYKPFLDGTLVWTDFFALHNEHRIFTTRLLALSLLKLNGIWNPLLQMVVNAGLHIAVLVFGIVLLTRVIGRNYLFALLAFSLVLFGVPYAWENTLAGFQAQFYFVLLFNIACLWLTAVHVPLSVRWWGGVVCGVLAFLSLASGIFAFAAAATAGFIFFALGLRKTRDQLFATVILAGLFMLGAILTPSLAQHAPLKAASLHQFFDALMAVLGWPLPANLLSALARNLPALIFAGSMLWKRPPVNDRKWFLLALAVWSLGQAASIAYGRATDNCASRYLDLFAMGILVNFACLVSIVQDSAEKWRNWAVVGASIWLIAVLTSLGLYAVEHLPAELRAKRDTGLAQELNVKNYLSTGDISHLKDKPFLHVPYPEPGFLVWILSSPDIRAILPANIRIPLPYTSIESRPVDSFVVGGFCPATPKRTDMTWGSYSAQGNAATGEASIGFVATRQKGLLAIPVSGYPLSNGIRLEIEQHGRRNPIVIKNNPMNHWEMAYAKVDSGDFSIHLTDASTVSWVAVGAPVVTGNLDALTNRLLANYSLFIILALVSWVILMTTSVLRKDDDVG